jgi:uncharacterized repeat protein (TIGR02543 family)
MSSQTKYYGKNIYVKTNAFNHANYYFYHWNTKSNNSGTTYNGSDAYTTNAAATLYAIWNPIISYNANGGSGAPSSQTKTYGTALTLSSTKPTRTNYVFKNWNTESDGTGTSYNPGASYTSNAAATLYAQWYAPYTVTPNANGGTLASGCSALTKVYNTALTLWDSSKNPTRTGYTFTKWNTKQDGSGTAYSAGASYTANAAATLYAQWTANKYTISFNANGGVSAPSSVTKTYGQSVTLPTAKPTRIGHTFLGWGESSSSTTAKWAAGATFSDAITANKTLYAVWRDDYTSPQITSLTVFRCDSEGNEDDEGSCASIQAAWSVDTSVDEGVTNSGTVTGTIAEEGGSPVAFQFSSGDTGVSGTATAMISNLNTDIQYTVRVTVTDVKGASKATTRTALILRAFYIMDFGNAGQSVGIGRAASNLGLEVGYETIFDDTVHVLGHTAYFRSSNFAHGTTPSTTQQGDARVQFQDDGGNRVGELWPLKWNNGDLGMRLEAKDPTQNVYNYLDVRVTDDGQKTYSVGSPANFRSAIGAVNNAGDTVTGIYTMKSTNIDRDGADPSSATTGDSYLRFYDKDNEALTTIYPYRTTTGAQYLYFSMYNDNANGTLVSKNASFGLSKDGSTFDFNLPGRHVVRSDNIDRDGANPSSSTTGSGYIRFVDKDGEYIGSVYPTRDANGVQSTVLYAQNEKSDGTTAYNTFWIGVSKTGTRTYGMSDTAAFRNAINAVWCSNQSSISAYICPGSSSTTNQIMQIWATCTNASNTNENGHRIALIVNNEGFSCYRSDTGGATAKTLWSFTTQNTSASGTSVITMAAKHTLDTATYYARNGVVQVRIVFKTSSTATGSRTIGTIVSGKRPAAMMYGSTTSTILSSSSVEASGAVKVYFNSAPSTSSTYGISFVYLLPNGDVS